MTDMTDMTDAAAVLALLAGTTEGEWRVKWYPHYEFDSEDGEHFVEVGRGHVEGPEYVPDPEDAAFAREADVTLMAQAPTLCRALAATLMENERHRDEPGCWHDEYVRATAERDRYKEALERFAAGYFSVEAAYAALHPAPDGAAAGGKE